MNIYVIATAGLLFLCSMILSIWIYERGMRAGMRREKGIEPEPLKSPLRIIEDRREAKATKAETDKIMEGMNNILSYTGDKQ